MIPETWPKPIVFDGLKKNLSFTFELKSGIDWLIVNESGIIWRGVDSVCAIAGKLLWTVRILSAAYMFNIFKVSDPIPIVLPTDTFSGISEM